MRKMSFPEPQTSTKSDDLNDNNAMALSSQGSLAPITKTTGKNAAASTMSLYQKYSDLNSGIDKARKERAQVEERMEKLQDEIIHVDQGSHEIQQETKDAQEDSVRHLTETQGRLADDFTALEAQNSQLKDTLNVLEARKKVMSKTFSEYQTEFLNESRRFRRQCKRLRRHAASVGIPHAFQSAYAVAMFGNHQGCPDAFDVIDNNHLQILDYCEKNVDDGTTPRADDDPMESTIETWDIPDDDTTLRDKLEEYKAQRKFLVDLQAELKKARHLLQRTETEKGSALERRDQLQDQLDRILQDNSKIKKQIQDVRHTTEEAKGLAETFSQCK